MSITTNLQKELIKEEKIDRPSISFAFKKNAEGKEEVAGIIFNGKEHSKDKPLSMTVKEHETLHIELKRLTGLPSIQEAFNFLITASCSFTSSNSKMSVDSLLAILKELEPKDHIEARLITQYIILDETANDLSNSAIRATMLNQSEFYHKNSIKARGLSLQAIHALVKYKNNGSQQINVVHMHDNAKAVIAQNRG